jgi:hypothetical protein
VQGSVVAALTLLLAFVVAVPNAVADTDDPALIVSQYSAALNAHDVKRALALFDPNGSATDASGRTFAGQDGLTEFLLANGFGTRDAHVTTNDLQVFGNRGLWNYTCTCAAGPTDVRVVLIHNRITVFFVSPLGENATIASSVSVGGIPGWPLGIALLLLMAGFTAWTLRESPVAPSRRPTQGRLLAALRTARASSGNRVADLAITPVEIRHEQDEDRQEEALNEHRHRSADVVHQHP